MQQEPQTKGWLFDSLVTPFLLYASVVWAPGLPSFMWTQLERPLVTMLSCQLRNKSTLPHDIIRVEFTLSSMLVETLFQLVVFIHKIHSQPHDRIYRQAFEAYRSLNESGYTSSWYGMMVSWLLANGLDINNPPPLRYNHTIDNTLISHADRNKVICQEIWQICTRYKWTAPLEPLPSKMLYYKEHFMHFFKLGFITWPKYLDAFLPNALRVVIGELSISSHQLDIENGRTNGVLRQERIYIDYVVKDRRRIGTKRMWLTSVKRKYH